MALTAVTITPIAENIYGVDAPCEGDVDVRALLICGRAYTVLIDTLLRPSDLDAIRPIVESAGRPLLIVNSHADWDHWWGNAAFPDAPIIAHQLTAERQRREGKRSLASQRRRDPEGFADVILRPATITFSEALDLDFGDGRLELRPVPGHTPDCIVAYLPERRILFAGDTVEDPIPLLNSQPPGRWPDQLLEWADKARVVVPAHGAIAGPELLRRNAAYLRGLTEDPARPVPEIASGPAFYRQAHRRNIKRAAPRNTSTE